MTDAQIMVLGTGGTIAGISGSALKPDYRPGQISIEDFLQQATQLGVGSQLVGQQIANIGSEDIGPGIWGKLHSGCLAAIDDDQVSGIIITHGTDTAEETAFLLDLTLPTHKPVVLVGAMRAADAVGSDGLRNFANAVRVANDPETSGRGVLVVMNDRVIAARDLRKARSSGTEAFRGFPRDSVATVAPSSLDWFGGPWRVDEQARFDFPQSFPNVPILCAYAGMDPSTIAAAVEAGAEGIIFAGFGNGTMPRGVEQQLHDAAQSGIPIVRASRVDEGLIDRKISDGKNGFIAARALNPPKARILLQLLIAAKTTDPLLCQQAFDRR